MVTSVTIQTGERPATAEVSDAPGAPSIHPPTEVVIDPNTTRTILVYGSVQVVVREDASAPAATTPADAPGEG